MTSDPFASMEAYAEVVELFRANLRTEEARRRATALLTRFLSGMASFSPEPLSPPAACRPGALDGDAVEREGGFRMELERNLVASALREAGLTFDRACSLAEWLDANEYRVFREVRRRG